MAKKKKAAEAAKEPVVEKALIPEEKGTDSVAAGGEVIKKGLPSRRVF